MTIDDEALKRDLGWTDALAWADDCRITKKPQHPETCEKWQEVLDKAIAYDKLSSAANTALVKKLVELLRGWDCVYRDKETPEEELAEAKVRLWMTTIKALTEAKAYLERQGREVVYLERLKEIYEYAGHYIGCFCNSGDFDAGDCWACRMMRIIDMAFPADEGDTNQTQPTTSQQEARGE